MKRVVAFLLVLPMLLCFAACKDEPEDSHPLQGCYIYGEHEHDFMNFQLTLLEDGRFTYYATPLSSYIGVGEYVIEGDIITLTDEGGYNIVNRFRMKDGKLVFIEEGSTNFMYVSLKDGEAFEYAGEFRGTGFYEDSQNETE